MTDTDVSHALPATGIDGASLDAGELKTCVRDLVALLSLPVM
jgi:hypothetical protein